MELQILETAFSVCQLKDFSKVDLSAPFTFTAATDKECALVCPTERVPDNVLAREDGWRAFRVAGVLEFSLVGILAKISAVLAARQISLFAVSTYYTDYALLKADRFDEAMTALEAAGYKII